MEPFLLQKTTDTGKRQRIIFHIDVNSAYLSWSAVERLKAGEALDLRKIPAIVGGDQESRHGIVLAKSIPAKAYGIYTSQPVAQAMRLCPNLTMVPPAHALYDRYSRAMIELLQDFTPDLEQISIDECFLDFTPIARLYPSPVEAAIRIKDRIRSSLGFTVNIGIAPNKLLAKMASDFEKPDRVHTLWKEEIPEKMWPLSVRELYMVGRASAHKLEELGIRTIGELAASDPGILEGNFKSHGRLMWEYANGIDDTPVEPDQTELKGIGNSTTLREDARTQEEAGRVLLSLAESVASRLRDAGKLAGTVTVDIKYHDFTRASHQCGLFTPVNTTQTIYETACRLFQELWDGRPVRLLGIRTSHLTGLDEPVQLSLFDLDLSIRPEPEKRKKADKNEKDKEAWETGNRNIRKTGSKDQTENDAEIGNREKEGGRKERGNQGTGKENAAKRSDPAEEIKERVRNGKAVGNRETVENGVRKENRETESNTEAEDNRYAEEKQKRLDAALDAIRRKYGGNAVVRGSLLHDSDLDSFGRKGTRRHGE